MLPDFTISTTYNSIHLFQVYGFVSCSSDSGCGLCSCLLHAFLILGSSWWRRGSLGHFLCMAEGWSARGQIEESFFGTDQLSVQFTCHWPVQVHSQAHSKAERISLHHVKTQQGDSLQTSVQWKGKKSIKEGKEDMKNRGQKGMDCGIRRHLIEHPVRKSN